MKKKNFFYKYVGVLNILFFASVVFVCYLFAEKIDFPTEPLSSFGSDLHVGLLFNISLIVFSLFQVIFALHLCDRARVGTLPRIFFIAGGIALAIAGIFPVGSYPTVHDFSGVASALLVTAGVLMISGKVFPARKYHHFLTIYSCIQVVISLSLYSWLPGLQWEIILFLGIIAWNFIFSVPLILA